MDGGRGDVDNDLSAYSGEARPAYQRVLADLRDGTRAAAVVYHVDRLTRRPVELEEFADAAVRARHVRFVLREMDLGVHDGLMIARMLGPWQPASVTKNRPAIPKMERNASLGLPRGRARRPFGYDDVKLSVRRGCGSWLSLSLASVMGPPRCHEDGTTWRCH